MNSAAARIAHVAEPSHCRLLAGSGLLYDYLRSRTRAVIARFPPMLSVMRDAAVCMESRGNVLEGGACIHMPLRFVWIVQDMFAGREIALVILKDLDQGRS